MNLVSRKSRFFTMTLSLMFDSAPKSNMRFTKLSHD